MRLSWRREYLADAEAATITRDPLGLARALLKVAHADEGGQGGPLSGVEHLCIAAPNAGVLSEIFPTHPEPERRIMALAQMGPAEALSLAEPPDPEVQAAAHSIVSPAFASAGGRWLAAILHGPLIQGLKPGLSLLLIGWLLAAIQGPPATQIVAGLAGTTAALTAMRVKSRFYWWPLALVWLLAVALSSFFAGAVIVLVAGAASGAFARESLAQMVSACRRAVEKYTRT